MSMCELGQQPCDAACRARICEVQLSGLLGGWARRQVPHWEFLEEIFSLCCREVRSTQINAQIIYKIAHLAFPSVFSWGSKVFNLAENARATLPFVSHLNSSELCTQYHHSFCFIFLYSTSVCSAVNTNGPSLQCLSLYSRMWGLGPRDSWLFTVDY